MTAARFSRWVAVGVPVALAGALVGGGLAGAQSPAADPSAPPALAAEVTEIIGQVEELREFDRTSEVVWRLADERRRRSPSSWTRRPVTPRSSTGCARTSGSSSGWACCPRART